MFLFRFCYPVCLALAAKLDWLSRLTGRQLELEDMAEHMAPRAHGRLTIPRRGVKFLVARP